MSKKQFWILILFLCGSFLSAFVSFLLLRNGDEAQVTARVSDSSFTYLLAGVDEAGENTDMLTLCRIDREKQSVCFLQIPRDTFYKTDAGSGKINRIYRTNASKYGKKRAAEELCKGIATAFGVVIDGYVVFDTKTVSALTELVGGVPVCVPYEITYFDGKTGTERKIAAGERILNGEEAVAFVRHRKSYAEGDLGRLDAQMRFMSAISTVLPSFKKIDRIVTIYQKILPNLLTNLTEKDIMEVMMAYLKNRGAYSVSLSRLPGEACYTDGVWYYVPYREASEALLREHFGASSPFDKACRFTDPKKEVLSNVYFSPDASYKVYTPDEVANKKILHS